MSDQQRQPSSPFSASPGRLPSIARPEWPWSARSYSHSRASQSSMHSTSSAAGSAGHLQTNWEPSRSISSAASSNGTPLPSNWRPLATTLGSKYPALNQGETTRQWSFTGLEWTVRDVQKLRDFIEGDGQTDGASSDQVEEFEVLKQSPIMGDKFKLEIASTQHNEESLGPPRQALSLFVTSLTVEFAQGDYEVPVSMMAAIRHQDTRVGERGVRADWVWQFWQHDWVFRQESEVWECPLPSLSELLQNPRIQETDSFIVCVQVHSPAGPSIPEQPSVAYVPRDLLDGLEASLDNPNTGDVRFICLERFNPDTHAAAAARESPELDSGHRRRPSSSTSSHSAFSLTTTARKRVIYAHSDILTRRSEYFANMLSSAFSEGAELVTGERKIYTVVVEEADFETMYWLLKFCYANWLLFKEHDDPRAAVEGVGAGWSAKWLASRNGEWDWKTFHKLGPGDETLTDARSATSVESLAASAAVASRSTSGTSEAFQESTLTPVTSTASGNSLSKAPLSTPARPNTRRPTTSGSTLPVPVASSSGVSRPKPEPVPIPATRYAPSKHYPISPRATRQQQPTHLSSPDPHSHPTPAPPPASALSMYQVAHRYTMPGLANIAMEHMMSAITPQSSFALLLATTTWEELHTLIQDYVIEKWEEVSASEEFERCCQEIAAGEWGPNGGKTLTAVFRRLRSPSTAG